MLLRLRAAGLMAIGVDLSADRTTVATGDLAGRLLKSETFPTDPDNEISGRRITNCVRDFMRSEPGIEGIGVSLPGLVDPETGNALFHSALQMARLGHRR